MMAHLRARGTKEVTGTCLLENHAMAALARAAGMEVHGENGTLAMRLALTASPSSSTQDAGAELAA
jgi:hypothetical protein